MLKLIAGEMYLDEGEIFVINEENSELVRTNRGRTLATRLADERREHQQCDRPQGESHQKGAPTHRQQVESPADADTRSERSVIVSTLSDIDEESEILQRPAVSDAVQISFCPQCDPLFEQMTVAQNLNLCAQVRGVRPDSLRAFVDAALEQVGLDDLADTPVHLIRSQFYFIALISF